jgi:pyruvate,water dikinase
VSYTLGFEQPAAAALECSGGKGANLSLLTQRGFPVPAGFIVSARAYRDWISGVADMAHELAALELDRPQRLREQSVALRERLGRVALPDELIDEVRSRLSAFEPAQAFSVRSSSTMEDLAGAAFAGQHDTFLNCVGEDEILRRLRDCFGSLWVDRAIAYRARQGFDHGHAAMAVVVQTMVQCDVAGVAFTINPVSGDLDELVIDANFGLGESVVSGEGEVDHWAIDKRTRRVRQARIAGKSRKIVSAEQGTREVALSAAEGRVPALDATQLESLAELATRVEASYRFPQDIEWGIAQGHLYLLQARPITTIPPRWTRDESAERFPTVITPLTWDFVDEGFHRSLTHSLALMGFPPFHGKWFELAGHYVYGNQNAVELYAARNPLDVRSLEDLAARLPQLRHEFRWVQELPILWSRDLDHYLLSIGELMSEPLAGKSLAEVWDFVLRVQALGADYFLPNIAISITHGSLYRFLHWLLSATIGKQQSTARFDALMAFCDTKTGAINRELYELARGAGARGAAVRPGLARGRRHPRPGALPSLRLALRALPARPRSPRDRVRRLPRDLERRPVGRARQPATHAGRPARQERDRGRGPAQAAHAAGRARDLRATPRGAPLPLLGDPAPGARLHEPRRPRTLPDDAPDAAPATRADRARHAVAATRPRRRAAGRVLRSARAARGRRARRRARDVDGACARDPRGEGAVPPRQVSQAPMDPG